jgi:hypothetical protein
MAGHSRPKDGVASLAYVPAIHALLSLKIKTWMPGTRPGMTWRGLCQPAPIAAPIFFVHLKARAA